MTQISIHAPEQSTFLTGTMTAVFGTAIAVIAGVLAFAPFFMPIAG